MTQVRHKCEGWALVNLVINLIVPVAPGLLSRYSDSLRAGRSWDRSPVGARFSALVQTGPRAHPASYTMGNESFLGVKQPGPPSSSAEVKESVGLYLYSPSGPSWPVKG
jgi:hypothetical protein